MTINDAPADTGDIQALAERIGRFFYDHREYTAMPNEGDYDLARTILASDWLAARDAAQRADERERIAQASRRTLNPCAAMTTASTGRVESVCRTPLPSPVPGPLEVPMPELNAEQRLRDDAIVRGIIAQAQREAAQAVLDAVEGVGAFDALHTLPTLPPMPRYRVVEAAKVRAAARAAAAKYGAGTAAGGDGR